MSENNDSLPDSPQDANDGLPDPDAEACPDTSVQNADEAGEVDDSGEDGVEDEPGEDVAGQILAGVQALQEEVSASMLENKRNARRVLDAVKQLGEIVAATPKAAGVAPSHASADRGCDLVLPLIDLVDRVERIAAAYARPVKVQGWVPTFLMTREKAWADDRAMMAESVRILALHTTNLMRLAGLERISCVGRIFDPNTMSAVETEAGPAHRDQQVAAEILPGWRDSITGKLVRPAQVCVVKASGVN